MNEADVNSWGVVADRRRNKFKGDGIANIYKLGLDHQLRCLQTQYAVQATDDEINWLLTTTSPVRPINPTNQLIPFGPPNLVSLTFQIYVQSRILFSVRFGVCDDVRLSRVAVVVATASRSGGIARATGRKRESILRETNEAYAANAQPPHLRPLFTVFSPSLFRL